MNLKWLMGAVDEWLLGRRISAFYSMDPWVKSVTAKLAVLSAGRVYLKESQALFNSQTFQISDPRKPFPLKRKKPPEMGGF